MANSNSVAVKRSLLRQLVLTDFKLRYQGSVLGYVWSLLKPMMMFGVLYVVFTYIIPTGKDIPHFPAYLLLGIVVWTFFVEATTMGLGSIVGRGDMIKKVSISKVSIVIASVASAGVNFALNIVVVMVFMLASGAEVNWGLLWLVPLLIIELLLLVAGLAFILASLYVKFRDFAPIWEVVLQVMFYATPIIYPLQLAVNSHHRVAELIMINPLAQIIQGLREILITPVTITAYEILPLWVSLSIPLVAVPLLAIFSWRYFHSRAKYFVEEL